MYESSKAVVGVERTATEVERVCRDLQSNNEMLFALVCRLNAMHARIFGPAPQDQNKADAPRPMGILPTMRDELSQQRASLDVGLKTLTEIEKFS